MEINANRIGLTLRDLGLMLVALLAAGCATGGAVQTETASAPSGEYHIGPGDQLNVFVFNQPDLSVSVQVRPDGMISTPLVENMMAVGKTPSQLGRDVEKVLAEYIRTPQVNIIVTGFVGTYADQIRVVGEGVAQPRALPYRDGMHLLDVMIQMGTPGQFAALNRGRILRNENGKQTEIRVRIGDLINKGDTRQNLPMRPGDVVIIPQSRF
ncbi:MAG TPA: XrtA/PEP-CTERM system exopolysaccharide export protein [Steroidobacteraceae bacterium]|nr:XrtA/PEP-CTERM system exopolysaccharide export protein [Steroidobacteraceae bacterium]